MCAYKIGAAVKHHMAANFLLFFYSLMWCDEAGPVRFSNRIHLCSRLPTYMQVYAYVCL